jgi:hypothetical protein
MGAKMTTQGREDNILGGVPPEVCYAHWVNPPCRLNGVAMRLDCQQHRDCKSGQSICPIEELILAERSPETMA